MKVELVKFHFKNVCKTFMIKIYKFMIISLMLNIKKTNLFMHKIQYTFTIDK
jgi:hypothetical protein